MAAFRLAHLSDPHLPPLPVLGLCDLMGKRALGYLNWTRNRHKFQRRDVLDALVSDVLSQTPDHIAITGDFVNLALEAEFEPARTWLESVGSPDRVSIVPGNHDAYVRVTRHRFAQAWGKAIDYIKANPDAARKFLAKNTMTPDNVVDSVPMLGYIMTKDMSPKQLGYLQEFADFGQSIGVVPEKIDVKQDLQSF